MRLITLLTLCLSPIGLLHAETDFRSTSPMHTAVDNRLSDNRLCAYTKLGPCGSTGDDVFPSVIIAFGLRRSVGHGAVDLSAQVNGPGPCAFAVPRIQYLHYVSPWLPSSFYFGGGVSYGGTFNNHGEFLGLMGEATVGYNFYKDGRVRMFVEANVTQPVIPTFRASTYAPSFALAIGIGI